MNEIKRKSNINRAIQVINRTQEGLTISKACKEVGLPRSSYYYIVESEREALELVQDMVRVSQMNNLEEILANQASVLKKVIDDGLSEKTKPRERIAIHKYLDRRGRELMQSLQGTGGTNQVTSSDFTGPMLKPSISSNTTKSME